MATEIKTLKGPDGKAIAPRTTASAVKMGDGGYTLEAQLAAIKGTADRARPNDIRTYPTLESITTGDVVDVVDGNVTRLGVPSQAIALTSATAGQLCDVIFDGFAPFPGIIEGSEIISNGVCGHAPKDGWLSVQQMIYATNTVISAGTAELLGLQSKYPSVDEALIASVLSVKNAALVYVAVTLNGQPARKDVEIQGLTSISGAKCYTDAKGVAFGITTTASTTISTPAYRDMAAVSKVVSTPLKTIVNTTLALNAATSGEKIWDSSEANIRFSPYANLLVSMCGGGGGGGGVGLFYGTAPRQRFSGGGGGGGYATTFTLNPAPRENTSIIIGAGGSGGGTRDSDEGEGPAGPGLSGGTTSAFGRSAAGGSGGDYVSSATSGCNGGTGNGRGGSTYSSTLDAVDGNMHEFNDVSRPIYGGGGVSGRVRSDGTSGANGRDFGGKRMCGGGGNSGGSYGGEGGSGRVAVKWTAIS